MGSIDVVVTGAGGFIGGHLVAALLCSGRSVRAVDMKPLGDWFQVFEAADNRHLDVALLDEARSAVAGAAEVYNLAANMGGMGFIESHKTACMLSVLSSTHMLQSSHESGVGRYFYSSSACVYPATLQDSCAVTPLREEDVYPADPEDGYGWEKLFSERMCRHYLEELGLQTRVARYHNIYGEHGAWDDGREKAPAAICRKIAFAKLTGARELEIWGDGEQTRTFTYVNDCIQGTLLVAHGDDADPVNIGSAELVSINQLVDVVEQIAGTNLYRRYLPNAPRGVRGRGSDNTEVRRRYGWEPATTLATGMERTYRWIYNELKAKLALA